MVTVTFKYEPDEPDHKVGMSENEYEQLLDSLIALGATDVTVTK